MKQGPLEQLGSRSSREEVRQRSLFIIGLCSKTRKTFMDKYPAAKSGEISLGELMQNCKETFDIKKNRTLDRFRFWSRKQMPAESLEQF